MIRLQIDSEQDDTNIVSLHFKDLLFFKRNTLVSLCCCRTFPLSHFLEQHKRHGLSATLQRGDQEAGFSVCWRSYPALLACTALRRLLLLYGLSSYGPGLVCADWPCSVWTPTVPCSNETEAFLKITVKFGEFMSPQDESFFLRFKKK